MRCFVVKELTNNLYLSPSSKQVSDKLLEAVLFDTFERAQEFANSATVGNRFIWHIFEKLYGKDAMAIEVGQAEFSEVLQKLNVKVIPVEIHEGTYYE